MDISCDPHRTAQRVQDLDTYMLDKVLAPAGFKCVHHTICRQSHPGTFYEGQLHHVGDHYDLRLNDIPCRIAVVGQEYGHKPPCVNREDRTRMVVQKTGLEKRFKAESGYRARNPTSRGITSVLRLLLGRPLGSDFSGEFIIPSVGRVHIFRMYALTNFLLCSAVSSAKDSGQGSQKGRSTPTMRRNCASHFRRTMEILEPTVVILLGDNVWQWIQRERIFDEVTDVEESPLLKYVQLNKSSALLCTFTHPTSYAERNWGWNDHTEYLLYKVRPTIESVHRRMGLTL